MHDLKLARSAGALYLGALLLAVGPASPQSNPQRVEAKLVELLTDTGEDQSFVFSQAEIASLCGDGDGCKLRLLLEVNGWIDIDAGRYLATSSDSDVWLLESPGEFPLRGRLSDGMDTTILRLASTDFSNLTVVCLFTEEPALLGGQSVYQLGLDNGTSSAMDLRCTLRIDD